MSVRVATKETPEQKKQRLKNQRDKKGDRILHTLIRKQDEKEHVIQLQNIFRELGVDYLALGKESYARVREIWDGRRVDNINQLSKEARVFLRENFDIQYRKDDSYIIRMHFKEINPLDDGPEPNYLPSNFIKHLSVASGQPFSVVESVYQALATLCKGGLQHRKHRFHLPGLGRFSLKYRAATLKEGLSGGIDVPAKPARYLLRFTPSKSLKQWAAESVEVVAPITKRRKAKEKKRKHHKKIKYINDEQKYFHIA